MNRYDLSDYWTQKRRERTAAAQSGAVTVRYTRSRIQVLCPFHPGFSAGARAIGGRWRYRSKIWSFPAANWEGLRQLLTDCYGRGASHEE